MKYNFSKEFKRERVQKDCVIMSFDWEPEK